MSGYIKPSSLLAQELPYFMQMREGLYAHLNPPLISLIADYAGIPRKINTDKMIALFLEGPSPLLSKFEIAAAAADSPNYLSFLTKCQLQKPMKGATVLKISQEKILMVFANLYLCLQANKKLEELNTTFDTDLGKNVARVYGKEYRNFPLGIQGIDIIEKRQRDLICHNFVFRNEPWFDSVGSHSSLFTRPELAAQFLESKGYFKLKTAIPKATVMYCTAIKTTHYGIVDSIEKGIVMVRSKFGPSHVYRHRLELVPYIYGHQVFFFSKQKPTPTSKIGLLWGRLFSSVLSKASG